MAFSKKKRIITKVLLGTTLFSALFIGIALGLAMAIIQNNQLSADLEYDNPIPTRVLDRNGELITEFFEQRTEIVPIDELPKHLIHAVLSKEDATFYQHHGFSLKGYIRAFWNIATGQYRSGASTITQQVAGRHFADRSEISLKRKFVELWWSLQLEKKLTKNQILEIYLNESNFGHGNFGVEAASQFYFKHSARDVTIAEAAMLAIQLSSPTYNSPFRNPNRARKLQQACLNLMIKNGYITKKDADASFKEYWENYDYTVSNVETVHEQRIDRAPYFSEYVRQQLENLSVGDIDYYKDGLTVYTTLDLGYQELADKEMQKGFHDINKRFKTNINATLEYVDQHFVPVIDLLSLGFNLPKIHVGDKKRLTAAREIYRQQISPIVESTALLFDIKNLKSVSDVVNNQIKNSFKRTFVEGGLITIDNATGHILAMVGGSDFNKSKYNRAVQAKVSPGSTIKPLYYSAAISGGDFTPATMFYDSPVAFTLSNGRIWMPNNYVGAFSGKVLLRTALKNSMNIPSLKLLNSIGLDRAIDRITKLTDITDPAEIANMYDKELMLGLGLIGVSPIQMAKAFATFANRGRKVDTVAIRYVEDRKGKILFEPEKDLRDKERKLGSKMQIMDPQTAYIMVDLLKSVVKSGTLRNRSREVGGFPLPMAGKTGTTQNWEKAWTVGFSPYITTTLYFGFDKPRNSLGVRQTGATAAGPIWVRYMKELHERFAGQMPYKEFPKPETGLVEVEICTESGKLATPACGSHTRMEIFKAGTEPREFCTLCAKEAANDEAGMVKVWDSLLYDPNASDNALVDDLISQDNIIINVDNSASNDQEYLGSLQDFFSDDTGNSDVNTDTGHNDGSGQPPGQEPTNGNPLLD